MSSGTSTRTSERVESRVETVEVTEYQCANCSQWYDDESAIVPVALNAEADAPADADDVAGLCESCAEAIFGYEGGSDASLSALRKAVFPSADREAVKSFQQKLVGGLITLAVGGLSLLVGLQVFQEVQQAAASGEFEQEVEQTVTTGLGDVFGLVGVAALVMLIATIVTALRYGPRRI